MCGNANPLLYYCYAVVADLCQSLCLEVHEVGLTLIALLLACLFLAIYLEIYEWVKPLIVITEQYAKPTLTNYTSYGVSVIRFDVISSDYHPMN